MRITFLGAAGTVTGSRFLVANDTTRILVDCGLFLGLKVLRQRNWSELPFNPKTLDAVVLTHAHLDHCGFLPVLVQQGYQRPVYCTPPTRDLARILLADSGRIQEEDARYANRKGFSRHRPALPLYTERTALRAARLLCATGFGPEVRIGNLHVSWHPAGHILGAASVRVRHGERTLLFSGDLGRPEHPVMLPPAPPGAPDWVVMESTYGDRRHPPGDPVEALAAMVERAFARGGIVLVPAFAVGRAQLLMHALERIFSSGRLPRAPVYVDSPMAVEVHDLYARTVGYHRLDADEARALGGPATIVRSREESKALRRLEGPAVIVSASGMLSGGRVLHHLRQLAPDARNMILLAGFQAAGTRGAALLAGEREVKVHGRFVDVRAEVASLDVFSAHGDQDDLMAWLGACERPPERVFLVHGEPAAADALRRRAVAELGFDVEVAEHGQGVALEE